VARLFVSRLSGKGGGWVVVGCRGAGGQQQQEHQEEAKDYSVGRRQKIRERGRREDD